MRAPPGKRLLIRTLAVVGTLAAVGWLVAQSHERARQAEEDAQLQVQGGPGFGKGRVNENKPATPEEQFQQYMSHER